MPLVSNVGGSITGAVVATALALGVRLVLRRPSGRRGAGAEPDDGAASALCPRFLGSITPAALRLLVETRALEHLVIQVLDQDEPPLLPAPLHAAALTLRSPQLVEALLGPPGTWWAQGPPSGEPHQGQDAAGPTAEPPGAGRRPAPHGPPGGDPPRPGELVCVVSSSAPAAHQAACALAAGGFHRVVVTVTEAAGSSSSAAPPQGQPPASEWGSQAAELTYLTRDGLAVLLGYTLTTSIQDHAVAPHVLLDVRRHDERVLFGLLRGSVHVPAEQLPSALQAPPDAFESLYRFAKPQPGLPIILISRTSKRAAWAAQVCSDAGLWPVLVYQQGTYGWRLDESVKPHRHYRLGDAPPEPEVVQQELADEARGVEELMRLGLLVSPASSQILPPAQH